MLNKGDSMQANTMQVRKVMKQAIAAHGAAEYAYGCKVGSYTEKTAKKVPARRSVVYTINMLRASSVLEQVQNDFNALGYSNTVKLTGSGQYLRCIADIA